MAYANTVHGKYLKDLFVGIPERVAVQQQCITVQREKASEDKGAIIEHCAKTDKVEAD